MLKQNLLRYTLLLVIVIYLLSCTNKHVNKISSSVYFNDNLIDSSGVYNVKESYIKFSNDTIRIYRFMNMNNSLFYQIGKYKRREDHIILKISKSVHISLNTGQCISASVNCGQNDTILYTNSSTLVYNDSKASQIYVKVDSCKRKIEWLESYDIYNHIDKEKVVDCSKK